MKWLQHDTDASTDRKLKDLVAVYGAEGYGVYWLTVEKIAARMDPTNMSLELEEEAHHLAHDFMGRTPADRVDLILKKCLDLGLLQMSPNGRLMCKTLWNKLDNTTSDNKEIKRMKAERVRFQGTSKELGRALVDIHTYGDNERTDVPARKYPSAEELFDQERIKREKAL